MLRPAVLAVALVVAGCSTESREWPPDLSPCRGEGAPIDERTLERTLARFGFTLVKEESEFCGRGFPAGPAAAYTNIPLAMSETEADVIFASQSSIWCDLHHKPVWSGDVWRRRVGDDVIFRLLNVECGIYESHPLHIEWLWRAFRVLRIEAG